MTAITPHLSGQETLGPYDTRLVNVDALPWKPTPTPGIDMKVLLQDEESGMLTALFRWAPGTTLSLHEHVRIEQSFLLEGSLIDHNSEVTQGNFAWRPAGHRHVTHSKDGALVLCFFLKPNRFLEGDLVGVELK